MPCWKLFYHFVWSTRNREHLITPNVEPVIYDHIRGKAVALGATVYALNGISDYVHMVVAVPPAIALSTWIGQVKGYSSSEFNSLDPGSGFSWQPEYGVFSFDQKRLPNFVAYVENQKQHHKENTLIPILERMHSQLNSSSSLLHESPSTYSINNTEWQKELADLEEE